MKTSYHAALLRTTAVCAGLSLLTLSWGMARADIAPGPSPRPPSRGPAAPIVASAKPAVGAPVVVFVGFQAAVPSTGVVHHRIEPTDGSIALLRQAHQVPLLILLGVAAGKARLVLEYSDGHSEERTLDVRTGTPPGAETLQLHVGQVHTGQAPSHLKSFSAATSGVVNVQVGPNGQDYLIRAVKPGTTSVILIQDDGSTVQKRVEITP